jgi:PAS domain-containing protein
MRLFLELLWQDSSLGAKDHVMNTSDDQLRAIINTIPALVWSARPDGSVELVNRRWTDYTGLRL